jgi:hypothetical protein
LTTWPGTRAERFYRAAEWPVTGDDDGNLVFERTAPTPAVARVTRKGVVAQSALSAGSIPHWDSGVNFTD